MRETALDRAVALAMDDPSSDGGVFDALFNSELHLLLETTEGEALAPYLLNLEGGPAALAFDLAERLAGFSGTGAPYAAMPGRALVSMLAGRGVSLAINPGVAPSELFYAPEALAWAADFLKEDLAEDEARIATLGLPKGASPALLAALDGKLAALAPVLDEAWLVGAADALLLILRLRPGAEERPAARALAETARLAGSDDPSLDIVFTETGAVLLTRARAVGLGFELPQPPAPTAPGMDPSKPPKLR